MLSVGDFPKLAQHMLPSSECQTLVLWHRDLHLDKVFVDADKPAEIVGLIDWQNCDVGPLFDQVMHSAFLRLSTRAQNLQV